MKEQRTLGICFGASSVKAVELVGSGQEVKVGRKIVKSGHDSPAANLKALLTELNLDDFQYKTITGRKFKERLGKLSITEPEAVENGLAFLKLNEPERRFSSVASLGAENFIVYHLDSQGKIASLETESKCASGTGDFFLQQIDRIDLSVDEAVKLAEDSEPYKISGRCSVYCKSDCTHALNKGVPVVNVLSGLCKMVADKISYLFRKTDKKDVLLIGGVTKNRAVMKHLEQEMEGLYRPEEADVFEALGAAYYALQNRVTLDLDLSKGLPGESSFNFLPSIDSENSLVSFKEFERAAAKVGDRVILGLDVGSTTTKAVVIRRDDSALLASCYLRTNGDPIGAARNCYRELAAQLAVPVTISGLGVTGSGRKIAGLHAETDGIYNEIIAHATGAAFFDRELDTIFEIGGQDAKYVYLTNGVPTDYAMNEACSAGTGSFIEEAVKNSFSIGYKEIEGVALKAGRAPAFNEQCSAFINSDIKTAIQEGIETEEIVAGLIYSVCTNYLDKVKSQRPIGKKIFMQGGVCYNKAVPVAMANLLQREIVVPPEPGLTGAFGVALEVKNRLAEGLLEEGNFDLQALIEREVGYGKTFVCKGDGSCDRKCEINMLTVNGKNYPFGGSCNKYYNQIHHLDYNIDQLNHIRQRSSLIFDKYAYKSGGERSEGQRKSVGLNRSFLTHLLYPLYYNFFDRLGLDVVLPDEPTPEGIDFKSTSFCYPAEIAHGFFYDLLKKGPDYIFIPKVIELYVENSVSYKKEHQCCCLILQGESYVLKSAFKELLEASKTELLAPLIDFSQGFDTQPEIFVELAATLGKGRDEALEAYQYALKIFEDCAKEKKLIGRKILDELQVSGKTGIVLFGRPYNAMASEVNLGVPEKLASRGLVVIPWEYLPFENEQGDENMTWAMGQNILKAARFVEKHPSLFGTYVTNFSCGPDSFVLGYFRDIMGVKPSLTLEIDSHTADVGINTRIEAFLDVLLRYKEAKLAERRKGVFQAADIIMEDKLPCFLSSEGEKVKLTADNIKILIPSMGEYASEILAATFNSVGMTAEALPVYDQEDLRLGMENTIGKECLPMILVVGGLLKYLKHHRKSNDENVVLFMPSNPGNCRFAQYSVFINGLIKKLQIKNVALLSLSPENSYAGIPMDGMLTFLRGLIISDVMEDIKNALRVLALETEPAMAKLNELWARVRDTVTARGSKKIYKMLKGVASELAAIPLKEPLADAKKVALLGDFFARRDDFCCQDLIDKMVNKGIVVKREHVFGWFNYVDYLVGSNILESDFNLQGRIEFAVKQLLQGHFEKKIKRILAKSGLYEYELVKIDDIVNYGKQFFDVRYTGEQILVVGNFFKDILNSIHGAISIGPFACMPLKVVEALLSKEANMDTKLELDRLLKGGDRDELKKRFPHLTNLPYLHVESDGNPFPQIVEARIEAFALQVERAHKETTAAVLK